MRARSRRTRAQIGQLRRQILAVLQADQPQSVRHVFYRMTDPRLPEQVEKSDSGYTTVQRQLVQMRREGLIPYGWIVDSTRRGYFVTTYGGPADAIEATAQFYRRSVWGQVPEHVEVWCESRSIAGVLLTETESYAVPLYPSGGFTSLSLAYEAAQEMKSVASDRPIRILYVGDFDPAGVLIDKHIGGELAKHLAPDADFTIKRLAVTPQQIEQMGLPTKPAKDCRGGWEGGTVEAEAIPAGDMRRILREAIERFIPPHLMITTEAAEQSERAYLARIAELMREKGHA